MVSEFPEDSKEYIIKLPQHTKFEIKAFQEFLSTLSRVFKNIPFSFTLGLINKSVVYIARIPNQYLPVMENQLYSVFSKIEIEQAARDIRSQKAEMGARALLRLKRGDFYPFLNYEQLGASFLADIFNQLNNLTAQDNFYFQIKMKPVDYDQAIFSFKRSIRLGVKSFKERVNVFESIFSKKASAELRNQAYQHALEKNKRPLFETEISLAMFSTDPNLAHSKLEPIAQSFSKLESHYNEFKYHIRPTSEADMEELSSLAFPKDSMHLTAEEISTVFHFPIDTDAVPNLYKIMAPKAEPPLKPIQPTHNRPVPITASARSCGARFSLP